MTIDTNMKPERKPIESTGIGRRRLMRAGLSAAPVMLAFKSQSVLGQTQHQCIKPSAFSSMQGLPANAQLSHRHDPGGYTCLSQGYWKTHDHPSPYTNKAKSYFLTPYPMGGGRKTAGFVANPGGVYSGQTLDWVLNNGGGANNAPLARHVVGMFLTAVANNDDPNIVLLTKFQCQQLWDSQGNWSPIAGDTSWDLAKWLDYFNYLFGPNP